jgi:hypothetical protein
MLEKDKKNRFIFFDKEEIEEKHDNTNHIAPNLSDLAIDQFILLN